MPACRDCHWWNLGLPEDQAEAQARYGLGTCCWGNHHPHLLPVPLQTTSSSTHNPDREYTYCPGFSPAEEIS